MTVRFAAEGDQDSLERLASLDSASAPSGATIVAEFGGELVAALSIESGRAIADPFRHTGEVVRELQHQAAELSRVRILPRHAHRPAYAGGTSAVGAGC